MKFSRYFLATGLALFFISAGAVGQTPRRRMTTPPAPAKSETPPPVPQPVNRPVTPRAPTGPIPLAIVNGQTITTLDIDPSVRQEVENLDERIADTRRRVLELQINTVLLEIEAKKRRITSQQLYNLEVIKRVTNPTEAEIKRFIDENRGQLDASDETSLRPQVISLLRSNQEDKISEEFVRRLRTATPVRMGVDINVPDINPAAVLATVGVQPITAGIVLERLKPAIYKIQLSVYELEVEALEKTINDLLLIAEANRRNVPPEEIVRTEISDKSHPPTEAEVEKFYAENKARIGRELDTAVRNQLAVYLQEQGRQQLERAMSERLRQGAEVRLLISEPQPPTQAISADDDPSRGPATAPVTIVEFTDFQCPSCAAMHPVLEDVLKSYGNNVRFVVRDFPLAMHANARKAAEAANAAHAQGKFFEYANLLFKRQNAQDVPSLKKYASELGLDRTRFDAALDGGTFTAEVLHDISEGQLYGVDSTPTIFVNGVFLKALSAEDLRAAIDRALGATSTTKTPSN